MPSSSTHVVYHGDDSSHKPDDATNGHAQATSATRSETFSINRFLADRHQHPPGWKNPTQTEAEAEAAAKARMTAYLGAFDEKFGTADKPPGN